MEENNRMDELFRKAVEQYESSSLNNVWNNLDKKLDKKKIAVRRKKFFWFRIFTVLLLMIGSVSSYFYFSSADEGRRKSSVPSITESKRIADERRSGIAHSDNPAQNQIRSIDESKRIAKENHDRERKEKELVESVKKAFSSNSASQPQKKKEATRNPLASRKQESTNAKELPSLINTLADASSKHSVENTPTNPSVINNSGNDFQPTPVASQDNINTAQFPINKSAETKTAETTSTINSSSETKPATEVTNPSFPENKTEATAQNTVAENQTSSIVQPVIADSTQTAGEKKNLLKRILSTIASNTSLEVFYTPELVNRALNTNTTYVRNGSVESQVSNYANEKSDYSHSFGGKFVYSLSPKFSVSAGVTYTTYNQTATYNYINIISDSTYKQAHQHDEDDDGHGHDEEEEEEEEEEDHDHDSTWIPGIAITDHFVIYTSSGAIDLKDIPAVPGHNPINDTIGLTSVVNYKIYFLSIPVTLRYHIASNKFKYYAEVGVSLNYIKSSKAEINIADSYSETNTLDGLRKMNFSFILGAGAQYALNDHWRVYIGPNFRYSLSPVNENNPVLSSPYFLGIQSGLGFQF